MKVRKVGQGAYFVPSYSEQTVIPFQRTIATQTVTTTEFEEEEDITQAIMETKDIFTKRDFEKALKKARRRTKKQLSVQELF